MTVLEVRAAGLLSIFGLEMERKCYCSAGILAGCMAGILPAKRGRDAPAPAAETAALRWLAFHWLCKTQ